MDPNQQPQNDQQPQQPLPPQTPEEQIAAAGQNQWQYTSGQLTQDNMPSKPQADNNHEDNSVLAEWSASEFVEHAKGARWYGYLIVGAVVISAVLFLITREIMSVIVTLLLAVVMAIYGSAKPKTIDYKITNQGLVLGQKQYKFSEFKSFSIIDDSAIPYIQLMPQKRLMVPITIFVDPQHTNEIAELIGQYLPYDQKNRDAVDKLSSRLRF